jgi:putative DNA primase/helicase
MPHQTALHGTMDPLAVSVAAATRVSGIGRTSLYEAMGSGELASCKVGKRRLILLDDLRAWLARQRQAGTRPARRTPAMGPPAPGTDEAGTSGAAPLRADRDQLTRFVRALFVHAEEGGVVSLRAFFDDGLAGRRGDPPFAIRAVRLNGAGLEPLIDAAAELAEEAARAGRPVVVAPPIATFMGGRASERDLREGLAISVECDARAREALAALRGPLGPPTLVVASGGEWIDPTSGEAQPKLHAHWRLSEPAGTPEDQALLKRARTLACELIGADATSKPAVHPMRWAGTWHRKDPGSPRLARIVEHNPDAEVALGDALAELEGLAALRGWAVAEGPPGPAADPAADGGLLAACARVMPNPLPPKEPGGGPRGDWGDWNRIGMAFFRASDGGEAGFAAFDAWSRKDAGKYDGATTRARWEHYRTSPPTRIGAGTLVHEARLADPNFGPRGSRPDARSPGEAPAEPHAGSAGGAGDTLLDLSHDGLALALGREWEDEARHVALWGRWLFWTGSRWEIDERLLHLTRAREHLRRRAEDLVRAASAGGINGLGTDKAEAIAKGLRSAQTVANVVGLARSNPELAATVAAWDADPWLLNTPAGLVDLRTGALGPPDPFAYCTKASAVVPAPPGTPAPLWHAFLDRVFRYDPGLVGFVQRVLGYGLTGLVVEHVLVFAWGQGGNGKGVLFNTVSRLLGDYAAVAPSDLLLVTQTDRHPCDMAMLRGARLVTAQELAPGRAWDEPKLKSLTGGDPITARFMRQDFFTYEPRFLLVAAGNHKPSFKGVDEAIRRRVLLVPFLQNIPKEERDKDLPEKLRAEWPAILRWLIDGCLAWQREGLDPPRSVREASEDYLNAEDVLAQWLEERCVLGPKVGFTRTGALYADWRRWCERGGLPVGSVKAFSQRLSERGHARDRRSDASGFVGLGLRAEPEHERAAGDGGCGGWSDIGCTARASGDMDSRAHTSNKGGSATSTIRPEAEEFDP